MYRENEEIEIDLLELFYALRKKIVVIILAALLGAGLFGVYSFFIAEPVYESTSKIYILSQTTSITSLADIQVGSSLAKDYEEMIYSRPVVGQVITNLGLDYTYEELKGKLSVSNPADTRCLNISCRSNDMNEACNIANEFANVSKRQIADIMNTDEPTIFERAVVNKNPVEPHKAKNVVIGFLLGMLIACAVVIVQYLMNDSLKTEDDIERYLGLNTLASIPNEKTQKVQGLKFRESGEVDR
jgi:capsular polysaccharide biosynthesis protein